MRNKLHFEKGSRTNHRPRTSDLAFKRPQHGSGVGDVGNGAGFSGGISHWRRRETKYSWEFDFVHPYGDCGSEGHSLVFGVER